MATIREPMSPAGALRAKHAAFAGNFQVRLILGVTGRETLGPAVVKTVVWACLAFSLLLADIALQWQELRHSGRLHVPARSIA